MEVKEGYKKTVVGIVPDDWDVVNITNNSTLKARIGWQGLTTEEYLATGDYILITGTDFFDGKISWDTCHYVTKERYDQDKNIQIRDDDILITKDGTIGKVAFVKNLPSPATVNSGVFVVRPKNDSYIPNYLFYIFYSIFFSEFLRKLVAGSTINHLYQKDFISFRFPLPTKKHEQTAIAQVLSDTDELISSLEKLIEKKSIIRLAATQELLSGKTRLSAAHNTNFKETSLGLLPVDWKIEKLNRIAEISIGLVTTMTTNYVKNGVPLIRNSDIVPHKILTKNMINLSYEFANKNKSRKLSKGDIVTVHTGDVGVSAVIPEELDGCIGFATINTKVKESIILPEFLCCYFNSSKFLSASVLASTGDGRQNLNLKDFIHFEIPIPHIDEQQQIAAILSDMDAEIEVLWLKLNKYKAIKQGMMQNLLTGKIRLVKPEIKN